MSDNDVIRLLLGEGEAEHEVKRSRFIAYAAPVSDETAAQEFVRRQKKKYFDARHNSYAWVLGKSGEKQKSNDDGEPGGTAGNPILEAVKRCRLTNAIVVVTRYFGGIKLGTGGLVRAYGRAATLAIEAAGVGRLLTFRRLKITVAYPLLSAVENSLRRRKIGTESAAYGAQASITALVLPTAAEDLLAELKDLTAANFTCEDLGCTTVTVPDEELDE